MSSVINTNIAAIRTHNQYNRNIFKQNAAMTNIATGERIHSAKDGASKWAISEKMRERIRSNDQANQNVQNDNALLKTAEGGISNIIDMLKTLRERAIDSANDSNINTNRGSIQTEVNSILEQINYTATTVQFNNRTLLNGSAGSDSTSAGVAPSSGVTTTTTYTKVTMAANDEITDTSIRALIAEKNSSPSDADEVELKELALFTDEAGTTAYTGAAKAVYDGTNSKWTIDSAAEVYVAPTTTPVNTTDEFFYTKALTLTGDGGTTMIDGTDSATSAFVAAINAANTNTNGPANGDSVDLSDLTGYFADNQGNALSGTVKYTTASSTNKWYLDASSDLDVYTRTANPNYVDPNAGGGSGSGGTGGTGNATLNFFIGSDTSSGITFDLGDFTTSTGFGGILASGIDVSTQANAKAAISTIDKAITFALNEQTKVGSMETRLGYTADNLTTMNENLEAADSVMRDADIAKEMTQYMKYAVLGQASQYMLAQAGQNAYQVLNLLQQ